MQGDPPLQVTYTIVLRSAYSCKAVNLCKHHIYSNYKFLKFHESILNINFVDRYDMFNLMQCEDNLRDR